MAGFDKHVFVCLNEREPDDPMGCCLHRGSEKIFNVLRAGILKHGLKSKVRINRAGCMDHCDFGPTVVVYPEGVWYRLTSEEEANQFLSEHIVNGRVVEHLLIDKLEAKAK